MTNLPQDPNAATSSKMVVITKRPKQQYASFMGQILGNLNDKMELQHNHFPIVDEREELHFVEVYETAGKVEFFLARSEEENFINVPEERVEALKAIIKDHGVNSDECFHHRMDTIEKSLEDLQATPPEGKGKTL
ncbi:MAG: hypothetical protein V1746_07445 [bacterium]